MSRSHWLALLLVVVTAAIYAPAGRFDLIHFDDPHFLFDNPHLHRGITPDTLRWAVTDVDGNYWHPVTNLVHLVAFTSLGPDPGRQHVVNVGLFVATAALLFAVLRVATGRPVLAFLAAALWAWHPLRVESVAWLTERAGVLSGLFCVAALAAYIGYARRPSVWRYGLVALCFMLAMMSKPTLPALPVALMAVDLWPLGRVQTLWQSCRWRGAPRLVLEKAPLLLLAIAFTVLTAMLAGRAPAGFGQPMPWRDAALAVPAGLAWVLLKTVWPANLAVHYPWSAAWSAAQSGIALLTVVLLTILLARQHHRALLAGWIWFVLMLLPMLAASRYRTSWIADRYAYVPHVMLMAGIASAVVEGTALARIAPHRSFLRQWGAPAVVLAALALASAMQLRHWQNSESLFTHALGVWERNELAHYNLGVALAEQGRWAEAADHYRRAVAIAPGYADARTNLGIAAEHLGDLPRAERELRIALQRDPHHRQARFALARVLAQQNRFAEAAKMYARLAHEDPHDVAARVNLGAALEMLGDRAGAEAQYRAALRLNPNDPDAQANLSTLLAGGSNRSSPATQPVQVAPPQRLR